jgi:hypothetical protein
MLGTGELVYELTVKVGVDGDNVIGKVHIPSQSGVLKDS